MVIKYFDFNLKLSEYHKYKPANGNINEKKAKSINNKVNPKPGSSKTSLNDERRKKANHSKVKTVVIIVNKKDCLFLSIIFQGIHLTK